MSLGLSMVMTAFSSGIAIGPSIGGFLVFPDETYPSVFTPGNIFSRYSVLLPNVVIVVGLAAGVVLTKFFIPNEDKRKSTENVEQVEANADADMEWEEDSNEETDLLLQPRSSYGTTSRSSSHKRSGNEFVELSLHEETHQPRTSPPTSRVSPLSKFKQSKFGRVFTVKECVASCTLYGLYSLFATGFGEIFPLLAASPPKYHGMGFTTSQIGLALMSVTLVLIVLQITILPKITNKYGAKKVFIVSALSLAFLSPMLPAVALVRNPVGLWCALIPVLFLLRCFIFTGYLAINIFVNNSVSAELLGSANGMAMTFASVGRLIGPLVTGSLFSWSLGNVRGVEGNKGALGFPFNQFFTFYAYTLWLVFISVMVTKFPDSMNFKKVKGQNSSSNNISINNISNNNKNNNNQSNNNIKDEFTGSKHAGSDNNHSNRNNDENHDNNQNGSSRSTNCKTLDCKV